MTTTMTGVAGTDTRLAALLDKAEISELVDRYVVTLDTAEHPRHDLDWYRGIFTDDVRLTFPIGERRGIDGLPEFQRAARLTWQATHHLSGNHIVELDSDRARVRVQIIGTHVEYDVSALGVDPAHRMDMGGFYDATAVRTPDGWRIDSLRFELVWTAGGGTPRKE
jgi:hypothetical protein